MVIKKIFSCSQGGILFKIKKSLPLNVNVLNGYIALLIVFILLPLASSHLYAQETISFDDQGFSGCDVISDSHNFPAIGKNFRIYAANFDGTVSGNGSLWYETASGGCWHSYPTEMEDGGYITAGYTSDINFQWYHPQALVMKTADGSNFKFVSFKAHDAEWSSWGNYLKISGYQDGVLQGSESVVIVSHIEPYHSTVTLTDPIFEDVDEVRITMDKDNNPDFGNPSITHSDADGLYHSFDSFVVDNSGGSSNSAPTFNDGAATALTLTQNDPATSINSLLDITDTDSGNGLTWSVSSSPTNGALAGFPYLTTSNGGTITPSGLTYQPDNGYSGTDNFTIQISDGADTD